jgi:phosphatidylinositol alpha 1,6-mannosyltransferase
VFGIDNRALEGAQGHSARWNSRVAERVERLDVLVEVRDRARLGPRQLTSRARIIPVYVPHPLLYPRAALRLALAEHTLHHYDLATADDPFRPGLAALKFKKATGTPYCLEYHTDCFFNKEWLAERPLIHRAYDRIGRRVARAADAIRCVRGRNRDQLLQIRAGLRDIPLEIIPVPTDPYNPARDGEQARALRRRLLADPERDLLMLYVGRLAPVKRVDDLLRVFADLRERHPHLHLAIAGDGPERERIERLADQLGRDRLHLLGYVAEDRIFGCYGACDFFVNSAAIEPYGRVYLEAMSAAKPVISTGRCGAVEDDFVRDGRDGLVFDPERPGALREAIEKLVAEGGLRERLGRAAAETYRGRLDYNLAIDRMLDLWRRAVGTRPVSSLAP